MRRIRIVTDSVSDIPSDLAQKWGIKIVPIFVMLGEHSYSDNGTLDRGWFYEQLETSAAFPRTAAPPPEAFHEVYQTLLSEGAEDIIGLFVAGDLSSVDDNARLAAQQLEGARVHVVETGQVSMGLGWMAVAAAEAAARGATVTEIVRLIRDLQSRTVVLGALNSLEHLSRGGRVSWSRAWIGDLLKIKILLSFRESQAELTGRVRTQRRALRTLADMICQSAPVERVALLHSHVDAAVLADFRALLDKCLSPMSPPVVEVGPGFGTHVGPRAVGAAVVFEGKAP